MRPAHFELFSGLLRHLSGRSPGSVPLLVLPGRVEATRVSTSVSWPTYQSNYRIESFLDYGSRQMNNAMNRRQCISKQHILIRQ